MYVLEETVQSFLPGIIGNNDQYLQNTVIFEQDYGSITLWLVCLPVFRWYNLQELSKI